MEEKLIMKKLLLTLTVLLVMMTGCGGEKTETNAKYTAGTYEASADGMNGAVKVSVTVDADKITAIEVVEHNETAGISDPDIEQNPQSIIDAQSTEVEVVSGATFTSNAIINSVKDALTQASAK